MTTRKNIVGNLSTEPELAWKSKCAVSDCGRTQGRKGARGLCSRHYQRIRTTGSPVGHATTAEQRFFAQVRQSGECWDWIGTRTRDGYGSFSDTAGRRGRSHTTRAHRWAWEYMRGPIPVGLHIDHLCRNRACVNPDHLEPVPPAVNTRRGVRGELRPDRCKNGHVFSRPNTYINPKGARICRLCANDSRERWIAKNPNYRRAA